MAGVFGVTINVLMALGVAGGVGLWIDRGGRRSQVRRILASVAGVVLGGLTLWGIYASDKLETTAQGVVVSIVASALIFIVANRLFDLAPDRWAVFTTLVGGSITLIVFVLMWGNRIFDQPVLRTVVATCIGAVAGYLLGTICQPLARIGIGALAGAALGLVAASGIRTVILQFQVEQRTFDVWPMLPNLNIGELILSTLIGAVLGVAVWALRGRKGSPIAPLIWGATLGYAVGAWLMPRIGTGTKTDAYIAAIGLGLGLGAAIGLTSIPDHVTRGRIEGSARAFIFLIPALGFIAATLIIPTLRTLFLSFYDARGEGYVGFENYTTVFGIPNIFNVEDWTGIFGSRLFWVGAVLLVVGVVMAVVVGRQSGYAISFSPGSGALASIGAVFAIFAVFAALRGTLFNNLWWVFTVTVVSATAGLAIAVLADRSKGESVAKSLIFMPMAISFVGAGVIWRFMYLARDPSKPQTGVLNSLWVGLGNLSLSRGPGFWIAVVLVLGLAAWLAGLAMRAWQAGERGIGAGSAICALPLVWFAYALWQGIGGYKVLENGQTVASTITFTQESPFNNVWLMLVLIWIQTGFTMVIFSAAIKAVPAELIEAARVDGATESQAFWRVTIPQIAPTIGVVVTTLIVLVMKVFDIVKVMTNGNFGTQVVANEMWQRAFTELNFGLGSALAVLLFLAVLPIIYMNIRRMQKAAQ
ncbi:MAG: sugar ABC transporter permease [bacterium]|nr:sugar ABC transporter permease [bacterium]MCY3579502.1 sugar ABC transporter permease [bacterium]MDE0643451.1 sugar ABC transporter permease [bacterium]